MKEERFPQPGNPLYQLGDQLGQIGSFRGSEGSTAARLWHTEQRETSTGSPGHLAALPSQVEYWCSHGWGGSGVRSCRLYRHAEAGPGSRLIL